MTPRFVTVTGTRDGIDEYTGLRIEIEEYVMLGNTEGNCESRLSNMCMNAQLQRWLTTENEEKRQRKEFIDNKAAGSPRYLTRVGIRAGRVRHQALY